MKHHSLTLLAATLISVAGVKAQSVQYDSISMGGGYGTQIYYDMQNRLAGSSAVANWDIAHTTDLRDNCIRVNHMNGIQVFYYPKAAGAGWSSFDTTGFATWNRYYNDIHNHQKGALNHQSKPPFGIGWGTYNSGTHETVGDSLYLLAWHDGTNYIKFLKFQPIKQTISGNLIFRYANVDGTSEIQDTLLQSSAAGQNYKYYHFSQQKPEREPDNKTWDITFTRYYEPIPSGPVVVHYPVMGVESNRGTKVAKIFGPAWASVIADTANLMTTYMGDIADDLTAIGSGWKNFSGKWSLADTQSFMIRSVRGADSNFWLIHFTGFGGSANGKVVFAKKLLGKTNAVHHPGLGTISVFPVPASEILYVATENSKTKVLNISLLDLSGRQVYAAQNLTGDFSACAIPVHGFLPGTYLLKVSSDTDSETLKIVIQ